MQSGARPLFGDYFTGGAGLGLGEWERDTCGDGRRADPARNRGGGRGVESDHLLRSQARGG